MHSALKAQHLNVLDLHVQELTGSKNIKLKPQIDESLIAGFIVKYGSSEIDLSVKGQLNKISNELVSNRAVFLELHIRSTAMPPCKMYLAAAAAAARCMP